MTDVIGQVCGGGGSTSSPASNRESHVSASSPVTCRPVARYSVHAPSASCRNRRRASARPNKRLSISASNSRLIAGTRAIGLSQCRQSIYSTRASVIPARRTGLATRANQFWRVETMLRHTVGTRSADRPAAVATVPRAVASGRQDASHRILARSTSICCLMKLRLLRLYGS
jgi:hypothetical protein